MGGPCSAGGWLARLLVLGCLSLAGCVSAPADGPRAESMSSDQLVQNDINRVQTLAMRDNLDSLSRLLEKLYRRNPIEWRKTGFTDLKAALAQGDGRIRAGEVPKELEGLQDIEVLSVAMDPRYPGDRVAAFVLGLANMIIVAHGGRTRFHVTDSVSAQHVFNAARNVEIAAWMLATRRDAQGRPLLLSNELGNGVANLSFEREFGRMIARLDLVAELQDESMRRLGINYLQGLLFFNFLPVR
ncbi:hypothetical protein [Castellaniella caeni]|uniref:hypothetical protein n=1 Tax=Castellaniella caeni TaxID=266123 RepID=UPI000836CF74|nr:hypothetical protein [Castellaniella caeni]